MKVHFYGKVSVNMMEIHRYNVHFEYNHEIEVSVIVETKYTEESFVVAEARRKLRDAGFHKVAERKYIVDYLETIKGQFHQKG